MSGAPLVSVVMSVLNDERYVAAALESILSQEGVDLEFIVIDDGSTDRTGEILDATAARDPRLRVVHQENTGLTRALIRGCALARGKYIARQDAGGDVSLPGRLKSQSDYLEGHTNFVMASCGTIFEGPAHETLYEITLGEEELQHALTHCCGGPSHHGSAMFRRSIYESVGGYRSVFQSAQDIDLWLRMAEVGHCSSQPEVLYKAKLTHNSITALHREAQRKTNKVIINCAICRRNGHDETLLINKYLESKKSKSINVVPWPGLQEARFYYFIGSALRKKLPQSSYSYYKQAVKACIVYPRPYVGLLLLTLKKKSQIPS